MSKRYLMPHDTESAKQAMKSFSELAYAVAYKEKFQAAVKLLYGSDFVITEDLSKRMQFACIICNREMNSENAMQEHYRSGPHQKNRDKRNRESGGASAAIDAYKYSKDSLQFRLLTSQTNPIGLQMVEEYRNDRNNSYYKCFLCGAHGKLSDMYNHIINKAHTEKYIKTSIELESNILTSNEREHLRKYIIDRHGINVEAIKIIRGKEYYPKKWEAEARGGQTKIKKERRSMSNSPPPSARRYKKERRSRTRSISSSPTPSRYSRRTPSPTYSKYKRWSRYDSRSPSRSYKGSPSRRRSPSQSYSKKKSKSHRDSPSPSRSLKRSPSSRRTRYSRSPESSRSRRERRTSSSSPSSQRSQSPDDRKHKIKSLDKPSPREKSRQNRNPWDESPRQQFRNRSPPTPARIESQGSSWAMPAPSGYSSTSVAATPLPRPSVVSSMDKATQKVNLEELMMQLNFTVKTQHMPSSAIKIEKDVKLTLHMMNVLTKTLQEVNNLNLEDGLACSENIMKHNHQKEILKTMMSHQRKFMMPAANRTT